MANKTVIASGKGGVGKSTISIGLGESFAKKGKRTLLIDCDAGLSCLDILLSCTEKVSFSWYDVYLERCEIEDALISVSDNLTLLPSPKVAVNEEITDAIKSIINLIEDNFDIIILDAPAGLGKGVRRAALCADNGLIVAFADDISVNGASKVENLLKELGVKQTRLIINRYDLKAAKKGKLLDIDSVIDKSFVQLIGIVPEDRDIMYKTSGVKKLKTKLSTGAFSRISRRIDGEHVNLILSSLK